VLVFRWGTSVVGPRNYCTVKSSVLNNGALFWNAAFYGHTSFPPESDASAGRCQPKISRCFHDAVTFRRHLYIFCEEESRVVALGDELSVEGLERGGRGVMRQLGRARRRPRLAAHDTQYSGVFEACPVLLLATCPHLNTVCPHERSSVRYADYPDLEADDLRAVFAYGARLSRVKRVEPVAT